MIELFNILEGLTPNYLSELFVKADRPYNTRYKCKLMQPLKRTSTYGLRSFQYYGAHVWNILPMNMKATQSLHEFKSLIRSWPGPTCSCHICTALLWLMIDWLIDRIYFDWCYSYTCTLGTGQSVWRLCCRLWHCGLSLWQPAVPPVYAESSHWQLLSVLVFIPYEYICPQIVARADMFMSFMFCFTIINDWLVDLLYFDQCQSEICILGTGLSVWRPWCRLWCRWLSLWLPAVPPVDAGSSHWQYLSVLVFISNEYWSSLFRLILLIYMYTGDGAVGVTTMSSLVAPRVVLVTACGATGRCGVVTLTALSVLVFIPYENWSSLFRLILLKYM